MKVFRNFWNLVKERLSVRELASRYGLLISKDRGHVCPMCSYENKKQPSVFYDWFFFYCHKCKSWGDIFTLYCTRNAGNRLMALKALGAEVGIKVEFNDKMKTFVDKAKAYSDFAKKYSVLPQNVIDHLKLRGLTEEFIKMKKISWVPFNAKKETNSFLKEAGLPDICKDRVLIPFMQYGEIVYFTGYAIDGSKPKYKNILGPKTYIGTPNGLELIITEGIFDQLLAEQAGYNCIGIAGSSGKIDIPDNVKKVILIMDGDDQGRKYVEKYAVMLKTSDRKIEVGVLDEGTDLADFLKGGGKIENVKTY